MFDFAAGYKRYRHVMHRLATQYANSYPAQTVLTANLPWCRCLETRVSHLRYCIPEPTTFRCGMDELPTCRRHVPMRRSFMHQSARKTPVILLAACVVMQFALLEIRWILHRLLGPDAAPDGVPKRIS
jgi:hypothetical protein